MGMSSHKETNRNNLDESIEELKTIGTYRKQLSKAINLMRSVNGEGQVVQELHDLDGYLEADMQQLIDEFDLHSGVDVCIKCYSENIDSEYLEHVADIEVSVKDDITGEITYEEEAVGGHITTCNECGQVENHF